MPGTVLNPKPFTDQRAALPGPLRKVLDTLFPLDDPTMGLGMAGMAAPLGAVVEAPTGLVQALSPLAKGSLQRGGELASELAGRAGDLVKPVGQKLTQAAAHLSDFLGSAKPEVINPDTIAALSKVTGARPPTGGRLQLPEGFGMPSQRIPMVRGPELDRMDAIWKKFEAGRRSSAIDKPLAGNYGQLSGKWKTRGSVAGQKNTITADIRKAAKTPEAPPPTNPSKFKFRSEE